MSETAVVADLFYLPPLEFFVAIKDFDTLRIEAHENYQKQSYRNRAYVRLANKVAMLSIPVIRSNSRMKYTDVKIDDSQAWRKTHLRGMKSGYGKAPYFEYLYPELEHVYQQKINGLYEFNTRLLTICLKFLGLTVKMEETLEYGQYNDEKDLRGLIKSKQAYGHRSIYAPYPYPQIFGVNFVPNLSVIDLLFCEGPRSKFILSRSKKEIEHS